MAWETRGTCGPYYTRSRRVNGRVAREYLGSGLVGEYAAMADTHERDRRKAQDSLRRMELKKLDREEARLDIFCAAVEALARATMYANGFHRHKKGEWRKRRGRTGL